MFDTIILLTGRIEATALSSILWQRNPRLDIRGAESLAQVESIDPALLTRARLIGFFTPVIVPSRILELLGYGAYNFHPGPPNYPGWLPAHFAIYDRAKYYGATAHLMTERVDAGPIVDFEMFAVPPNISVQDLEGRTFATLARMFWNLAKALATQSQPLPELPIKWSGRKTTRRQYESMCHIPAGISKEELDRRIEAFGRPLESAEMGQRPRPQRLVGKTVSDPFLVHGTALDPAAHREIVNSLVQRTASARIARPVHRHTQSRK